MLRGQFATPKRRVGLTCCAGRRSARESCYIPGVIRRFCSLRFAALACLWAALSSPSELCAQAPTPAPAAPHPGEAVRISLVTFGAGDSVHQYFGHDALMVDMHGQRSLYNYGMFSFGPDMLANFLMGRLTFWVAEMRVAPTYQFYRRMRRSIRIQELDLPPEARMRVALKLADNVLPDNRDYLYHHYYDNCTTRLRDILDMSVDGQLKPAMTAVPSRHTYRGHTRRYTQHDPFIDVGLQFMMNDSMEQSISMWEQAFLPNELAVYIADFEYTDPGGQRRKLVARDDLIYDSGRPPIPDEPYRQWPITLLLGCLLGGLAVLLARRHGASNGRGSRVLFGLHHTLFGLLFGVPGLLGALCWGLTEHAVTYGNENMWHANPMTTAMLPLGIAIAAGSARASSWAWRLTQAIAVLSILGLLSKALPMFNQDNWVVMTLILPTNLGFFVAHRHLRSTRQGGPT